MRAFDPLHYPAPVAAVLREADLMPLGPGRPHRHCRAELAALTPESMFLPFPLCDRDMAMACRSALWLLHNFLDDSHAISQEIQSTTGSYWHGIMHRREPDYGNAKYWFRRVGDHPIFGDLGAAAQSIIENAKAAGFESLTRGSAWDPFAFIDLCEAAAGGRGVDEQVCRRIQQREWELLFDWCYRQATGASAAESR